MKTEINRFLFLHIFLLSLLYLCLLNACASTQSSANKNLVFDSYQVYATLFNEENNYTNDKLDEIFSALTPRYQSEALNFRAKTPELIKKLVNDYLSFPLLLDKIVNHLEKVTNNHACLVINGTTKENKKIAFYLTYRKHDRWLLDYIKVEHMAGYNQYLTEALCDSQKLDELRFKEMMNQ